MLDFCGRDGVLAYWGYTLLALVIFAVEAAPSHGLGTTLSDDEADGIFYVAVVFAIWIWTATSVRRCHDLGWTGWWILLRIIPVVNVGQGLWLMFVPGDEAANKYG